MRISAASLLLAAATTLAQTPAQTSTPAPKPRRNVILFVADGLRRGSVSAELTPNLWRIRTQGTDFRNSHSVFPTVTTANASAIATGHGLGDTGDYGNDIWPGKYVIQPGVATAKSDPLGFLEDDAVLADMNAAFEGNYLGEQTLLGAAQAAGYNVAAIGKLGPTAIQLIGAVRRNELGQLETGGAIIIDDATGHGELPLNPQMIEVFREKAHLIPDAPNRTNGFTPDSQGNNGRTGDAGTPGTLMPDRDQIDWFADVATKAVLPSFADEDKPFVLMFWSRDPDGTQHNEGDSFQTLSPGINGDTGAAGVHQADLALGKLLAWLDAHPAIKANTDVFVTSDHGFATVSRREIDREGTNTAGPSSGKIYVNSSTEPLPRPQTLPPGFLAIDLATWMHLRVFDTAKRSTTGDSVFEPVNLDGETGGYPSQGSAALGETVTQLDASDAKVLIAGNGGADLLYVPSKDPAIVRQVLNTLVDLDYINGIFVDDAFCSAPTDCAGALPLSAINLKGSSRTPRPTIVVSYRTFTLTPGDLQTTVQVTNTTLQEGQGNHGALGRALTWNNMAAIGPDFQPGTDDAPASNMDIAPTLASVMGLTIPSRGTVKGRILTESLTADVKTDAAKKTLVSAPAKNGKVTVLDIQQAGGEQYVDRACFVEASKAGTPACVD